MKANHCKKFHRLLAAAALFASAPALAAVSVWDGGGVPGNSVWNASTNWTGNVTPPPTNDVQFADGFGSGTTIQTNGNRTVNSLIIHSLLPFTISGNPGDVITLTSGAITRDDLVGDEANHIITAGIALGANASWSIWGSGTLQIDGPITQTAPGRSLSKFGWGRLLLTNGSGNYSGGTLVDEATLQLNGVWNGTGVIDISAGAGLDISAATIGNPLNLRGNGEEDWGALRALNTSTVTGAVTLSANSSISAKTGVLTMSGVISDGFFTYGLTKIGAGELRLTAANAYKGGTIISEGQLSVAADSALGAGPVTLAAGKLLYTANTSTSRSFSLNAGRLQAAAGATVTLNSAHLNGGFLGGPGTFSTTANAMLTGVTSLAGSNLQSIGPTNLVSYANAGSLTNSAPLSWDGGVNSSSGIITLSSNVLSATAFSNDGVITINNTASLVNTGNTLTSGGGSRITINAGGTLNVAGNSLELNGALLVNNGTITGLTNVNFGSLAKGAGNYGAVNVTDGGKFSPGNSPGAVTTGATTWNSGGSYLVEIADALAGAGVGWDEWNINGVLNLNAASTANSRFTIALSTLDALAANFDATQGYDWTILRAQDRIVGLNPAAFTLDSSGFKNPLSGGHFSLESTPTDLIIHFSAIPEPVSITLIGSIVILVTRCRRVRRR